MGSIGIPLKTVVDVQDAKILSMKPFQSRESGIFHHVRFQFSKDPTVVLLTVFDPTLFAKDYHKTFSIIGGRIGIFNGSHCVTTAAGCELLFQPRVPGLLCRGRNSVSSSHTTAAKRTTDARGSC